MVCYIITVAIKNYTANVKKDMIEDTRCRIWVEDKYQNRIAGDGKGDYHECSSADLPHGPQTMTFQTDMYWIHVKVQGSFRDEKVRGPYWEDTCSRVYGDVDNWGIDEYYSNCFE